MKEVEAYKLFRHSPHIIHSVDHSVASERGGGADPQSKTVYVLLPYYRRGNLQDMINANLVNHTRFPEKRLMQLFLGMCRGLKDMHQYKGGRPGAERMEMPSNGGADGHPDAAKRTAGKRRADAAAGADEDDEAEQQRPLMDEEDGGVHTAGGGVRSYAHRDIKPGEIAHSSPPHRHH